MRRGATHAVLWTFVALLVTSLAALPALAQDSRGSKLSRQISIMERVLDGVLIDSPNLLVSQDPSHGIYLEEFGVLFVLEASLIDWDDDDGHGWPFGNFKVERKDGRIIVYQEDEHDHDHDDDDDDEDSDSDLSWRDRRNQKERELYEAGKAELVDTLVDYGETLTRLKDEQWVAIAAFLRDSEYFMDNKISRLILKAKMQDLRDYSQERISRNEMLSRIAEEVY